MKKLALTAALILFPLTASAQSDYLVRWSIGTGLNVSSFKTLEVEISKLRSYYTLTGALIDSDSGYANAAGSCFELRSTVAVTGLSCAFVAQSRNFSFSTDINLTGSLTERDGMGNIIGTALLTISSIK